MTLLVLTGNGGVEVSLGKHQRSKNEHPPFKLMYKKCNQVKTLKKMMQNPLSYGI